MAAVTLVVGLGGSGINIVKNIANRAMRDGVQDVEFVVMDTDVNDLSRVQHENPNVRTIQTSPRGTVGAALDNNDFARNFWFPLNDGVMGKSFSEGAGQVRSISRLALDHTIEQGMMRPLEEAIESLRGLSGEVHHQEMRVVITGSLAGGTGSGMILPVGMYIRNFLNTRYQDNSAIIRGFFLEPDTFFDVIQEEDERNSLRSNAYAAVRELDAFFRKQHAGNDPRYRHIVFNAPQPGEGGRVDYPNILPYNFVFLMDAINEEGEHLPTKKDYERHAADIIFAQTMSQVSSRASSKEDNVIKKLAASDGRARYCGGGVSFLEYPTESIKRYVALRWASENLSEDWLELDELYDQRTAENAEEDPREFYRARFADLRKAGGKTFVASVGKDTVHVVKQTTETKGRDGRTSKSEVTETKDYSEYYVAALEDFISAWNESDLPNNDNDLSSAVGDARFQDLPTDGESYNQSYEQEQEGMEGTYRRKFEGYYEVLKRYALLVSTTVPDLARSSAQTLFMISKFDNQNVFENRLKGHYFESIVSQDGGKTAMHPAAVRYLLYAVMRELSIKRAARKVEADSARLALNAVVGERVDFVTETHDYQETVGEAVAYAFTYDEDSGGFKLSLPFFNKDNNLDPTTMSRLTALAKRLNDAKQQANILRMASVSLAFIDAVYDYLRSIAEVYEGFFKSLRDRIDDMSHEIEELERSREFNARRGKTHRYVCADERSIKRIYDECPRKGNGSTLPGELCADIYRKALRIVASDKLGEDRRARSSRRRQQFNAMFEDTVMHYWTSTVVEPVAGYPERILKTVTRALIDEARYAHEGELLSPVQEQQIVNAHIKRAFAQARHIATPFIESPLASNVRNIVSCVYSAEATKNIGPYYDTVERLLVESDGVRSEDYPPDCIMFYRSAYGFCADDLPKYAPAHIGHESRNEGEYHRVYWRQVAQLSPDLKRNKVMTPHVDKNWHLITFLPDLNEDFERELRAQTVEAFLYGLVWGQFEDQMGANKTHNFRLKHERNRPSEALMVSNHTDCDQFYEVLDALKFNPRIVNELLDRYQRDKDQELKNLAAPSVEQSALVHNLSSRAFMRGYSFKDEAQALCSTIREFVEEDTGERLRGYEDFTGKLVTSLFRNRQVWDAMSMLTIPVIYKISLRYGEDRGDEIEEMVETIFDFAHDYFALFCEPRNLEDKCERFYMEQYLQFEQNILWLERYIRGINANITVSSVRGLMGSLFERGSSYYDEVKEAIEAIEASWSQD